MVYVQALTRYLFTKLFAGKPPAMLVYMGA